MATMADELSSKEIRNAFDVFSKGRSTMDAAELRSALQYCGEFPLEAEVSQLAARYDSRRTGTIDYDSFEYIVSERKRGHIRAIQDELRRELIYLDPKDTGYVRTYELKTTLRQLAKALPDVGEPPEYPVEDDSKMDRSAKTNVDDFIRSLFLKD
ncbi:Calmodulin [Diplonema papillatum]|nr:Calmodulin [Diplonema papillatum]